MLCFNGEFLPASGASTDLYGQSLHYGYAVVEGIKAYRTSSGMKTFKAEEHSDRLKNQRG